VQLHSLPRRPRPENSRLAQVLLGLTALGAAVLPGAVTAQHPAVPAFERFFAGSDDAARQAEGGFLLLNELNCIACHAPPDEWVMRFTPRAKISLDGVGSRLDARALASFIANPTGHKPGTTMPDLFEPEEPAAEGLANLVGYLTTLTSPDPNPRLPEGAIAQGRALYESVGCVACHAPNPGLAAAGQSGADALATNVALGLAFDYHPAALTQFLLDPLTTRPDGRMPASHLTETEAAHLTAYLHSLRPERARDPAPAAPPVSSMIRERGHAEFAARNCYACHATSDQKAPALIAKPLAALTVSAGCLHEHPSAAAPDFNLSPAQRTALRRALATVQATPLPAPITPRHVVDQRMQQLNCYACHARDGRGGVEPARLAYFQTLDSAAESLGEVGTLPPALEHTGRKLTREWWHKVLWGDGGGVRPYLAVRMPGFGRSNTEAVLDDWVKADTREAPVVIDISGQLLHQRAHFGRSLMGTNDGGLGCITCHGLKDQPSLGVPAVNLTHTAARLQPAYFKELLLDPQGTQPGTLMPPMFMGRPNADKEVEQLWTYLKEIDQQRLPDGLLRTGEYELKPEEAGHPLVLRTFLEGAGFRAIATGFPESRHAAFDAMEVRWALTWQGRFVDAMTTWEERAMTPVKPLGDNVRSLPAWMPFARLDSADSPWPTTFGSAAGYQYRGMKLDPAGYPTFMYSVGSLTVEDSIRPLEGASGFRRTLTVTGGGPGWWFRGLSGDGSPQSLRFNANGAVVLEEILP
jgi:mono/diheme cytochrome c family protein